MQQAKDFPHRAGIGFGERGLDHDHVIEGHGGVLLVPGLRCRVGFGDHAFEPRIFWNVAAENGGVELALEQHFGHVLACRGALDTGRVAVFGHMGVLKRHPFDLAEIDTVILPQNAAQPHAGGLRERSHANATAG